MTVIELPLPDDAPADFAREYSDEFFTDRLAICIDEVWPDGDSIMWIFTPLDYDTMTPTDKARGAADYWEAEIADEIDEVIYEAGIDDFI